MPSVELRLSQLPIYEVGAVLLTVLGWPELINDPAKAGLNHQAICRQFIQRKCDDDPQWEVKGRIKPVYFQISDGAARNVETKLLAKLREREIAAMIAIPFIRAGLGHDPGLPDGVTRLSVNALAERFLPLTNYGDAHNMETRVFAPSRPVLHIAAALHIIEQEARRIRAAEGRPLQPHQRAIQPHDLCQDRSLIDRVVLDSHVYAEGLIRSGKFPDLHEKLIVLKSV